MSSECDNASRQDWKRHKPFCKPVVLPEVEPQVGADTVTEPDNISRERHPNVDRFSTDGKERVVYIPDPSAPGGTMRITSTTMSAPFMREMRESVQRMLQEQN